MLRPIYCVPALVLRAGEANFLLQDRCKRGDATQYGLRRL